ncbi:Golgin, RAB6-interacting [Nesidiocoris tenuis]|nr:Golgin, RAB6-interacting [Nesidiocoris tenuis]
MMRKPFFSYGSHSMRRKKPAKEEHRYDDFVAKLKEMDEMVSTDVAALRGDIELASLELREAQRKLVETEKAYIEAKTDLFLKKEKKELLTSHLCAYIKRNEIEKAKTLSGFVGKLELTASPSKPVKSSDADQKDQKPEPQEAIENEGK